MKKTKIIGTTAVGLLSALLASLGFVSCSGFPIIAGMLSAVGIGAAQLSFFSEYQVYFLLFAIISLGVSFWMLYFRNSKKSSCCTPQTESKTECCTPKPLAPISCCGSAKETPQFTFAAPVKPNEEEVKPVKKFSFKKAFPHIVLWLSALLVTKMLFVDMDNNMNEGEGVNTLVGTMQYFVFIVVELIVLFVGITAIIEVIMMHIPQAKLRRWLSGRGLWGNILATVFGALTPFCACSTIPMTVGFLRAGVSFGSVMSFLISSPLLNPIIIGMLVTLMGVKAASIYFGVAFVASVFFGYLMEKLGAQKWVKSQFLNGSSSIDGVEGEDSRRKLPIGRKWIEGLKAGWKTLKPVMLYLLIGVALGAAIYGYMPEDFVLSVAGEGNPFAVPAAAIMGVPLYIRAETAIPIGIALMGKGMSEGAVIALIIGGAGMAIPEMTMMASIFKRKLVAMIVVVIFLTAVIGGYLFNVVM